MTLINVQQISQLVEVYSLLSALLIFSVLAFLKLQKMAEETILVSKQLFLRSNLQVGKAKAKLSRSSWIRKLRQFDRKRVFIN